MYARRSSHACSTQSPASAPGTSHISTEPRQEPFIGILPHRAINRRWQSAASLCHRVARRTRKYASPHGAPATRILRAFLCSPTCGNTDERRHCARDIEFLRVRSSDTRALARLRKTVRQERSVRRLLVHALADTGESLVAAQGEAEPRGHAPHRARRSSTRGALLRRRSRDRVVRSSATRGLPAAQVKSSDEANR